MSYRCIKKAISTIVIDGSAILHLISWLPSSGDCVVKFRYCIEKQLQSYDVYLVFDRYRDYSTHCVTRASRGAQLSRAHQLLHSYAHTNTIGYPNLTIPDTKCQLIGFIVDDLCSNTVFPETQNFRRLVVTGEDLFLWN